MAALIAGDTVVLRRQEIDYLALPLVAPLNTDDCYVFFHLQMLV
jgi:hypothetical protein